MIALYFSIFRELMSHSCSSVFPSQYTFILYRSRCLRSRNMQFQSPSMFLLSVSVGEIIPPLCNFCSFGQHLRFSNLPRLVLARTSNTCLIRSKFVLSSRSSAPRLCKCRLVILHERLYTSVSLSQHCLDMGGGTLSSAVSCNSMNSAVNIFWTMSRQQFPTIPLNILLLLLIPGIFETRRGAGHDIEYLHVVRSHIQCSQVTPCCL